MPSGPGFAPARCHSLSPGNCRLTADPSGAAARADRRERTGPQTSGSETRRPPGPVLSEHRQTYDGAGASGSSHLGDFPRGAVLEPSATSATTIDPARSCSPLIEVQASQTRQIPLETPALASISLPDRQDVCNPPDHGVASPEIARAQATRAVVADELRIEIRAHKITVTHAAKTLEEDWLSSRPRERMRSSGHRPGDRVGSQSTRPVAALVITLAGTPQQPWSRRSAR